MDVLLKWRANVLEVLPTQLILKPEHGGFGRVIFRKPTPHNFRMGDELEVALEIAKAPPPLNMVSLKKIVTYGLVRDVVTNGIVLTRWTAKGGYTRNLPIPMWDELLVVIDEKMLGNSPFYIDDCIRCRISKV